MERGASLAQGAKGFFGLQTDFK
ncbi:hypothetical protein CGLO_05374 [Colletotrichum gloeosporioides Cg-14]|uniref:Uncharacterized protein n=1 Tax=Colletotrichum gloeosporioides (strain Cg-14) TaxID=1237896 RepID=T0KH17_COLGC|nr:hypothetical protein CGLO_05374 [Colletotrichum gloeosporioides Cg-14]